MENNLNERFWNKVDKTESCWLWKAALNNDGYGNFNLCGRGGIAHKLSYESLVGPVPDGLELDHLCRIRNCVNPAHLEPVTHKVNVQRGELYKVNASKTHCPHDHPYSGDNLYLHPVGQRVCRTCNKLAMRKYRAKKKLPENSIQRIS